MRLIDADALLEGREDHEVISTHLIWNAPTIDAVKQSVYNQVRWERDTAIEQLFQIGKGLGERMDDIVKVVRCKDCINWERTWTTHSPDYHYCSFIEYLTYESFYCAKAERRTDETD